VFIPVAFLNIGFPDTSFAQWPGWGGPKRDFVVAVSGLASHWSEQGPKKVWTRPLGEGYSMIAAENGRLFTSYREGEEEIIVALDAETGETVWEHQYPAAKPEGVDGQFGLGPAATPTIHEGRVYSLGRAGRLVCLDAQTGKSIWSHDLVKDFSAKPPHFGFSASPLVYGTHLIAMVGGKEAGVMAFDLATGSVAWRTHDFENLYASPSLIRVDGEDQIAAIVDREVVGLSPKNGEILWRHPFENQWKTNVCSPIWCDGTLFVSSGGDAGSRGLKLSRSGGTTKVEEAWSSKKMAVGGHSNAVRVGDYVYGSSGSSPMIAAVNVKTGELAWRKRGFSNATVLYADGKLIVLDEDGNLALTVPQKDDLKIESKVEILKKQAWTAPTLIGKRMYLRDKETIMALDLGTDPA
jgi:outer membrane protein assembly factor BamB